MMKKFIASAVTGAAMVCAAGNAQAAETFDASSVSLAYSNVPTADLHKTSSPSVSYNNVLVSPQILTGSFSSNPGEVVDLFGYCVDIFQYAGATSFKVMSLEDYLGDSVKYDMIASLISSEGAAGGKQHDAAVQLAIWEIINETMDDLDINKVSSGQWVYSYSQHKMVWKDTSAKQFWADDVHNGSGVLSATNGMLGNAADNAGNPVSGLNFYVLQSDRKQDFLFWTNTPAVPEPATWAMMLIGFGAIGQSMRSRRRMAVSYS